MGLLRSGGLEKALGGLLTEADAPDDAMDAPEPDVDSDSEYNLCREISEDYTHGYIRVALPPGAAMEDVKVQTQGDRVIVEVEHQRTFLPNERAFRTELAYGKFSTTQRMPRSLFDLSTIEAKYWNGLLILKVAKNAAYVTPEAVTVPVARADATTL